jgi:hypothetical protein
MMRSRINKQLNDAKHWPSLRPTVGDANIAAVVEMSPPRLEQDGGVLREPPTEGRQISMTVEEKKKMERNKRGRG